MPTMRGADRDGPLDLALVVGLDQHGEAELERERVQVGEQAVVGERGDDEQHRVGADASRLEHLHLVDHEVLAQRRERGRLARGLQVGDRAAEERIVGEHRERGRAPGFVQPGRALRIEVGSELTLRRRAPLDLRDHGEVTVGPSQRAAKSRDRWRVERGRAGFADVSTAAAAPSPRRASSPGSRRGWP